MTKTVLLLFIAITSVAGWGLHDDRRSFVTAVTHAGMAVVAAVTPSDANAILSSKYCAAGVGDGCNDRSEGNDYIKSLQEKSALNREAYLKEATRAYQMKNYPDFFGSYGMFMVMKEDGSFMVLPEDELASLRKAGKIKMMNPTAFKGQTLDYTQKPIRVLVE